MAGWLSETTRTAFASHCQTIVRTAASHQVQLLVRCPATFAMETPCEPVIAVKAFLHRKWAEEPLEVRRFPFPAAPPLSFEKFPSNVASAVPTVQQEHLNIHWKGERKRIRAPCL